MNDAWSRYQMYLCQCPSIDLTLDISRMSFPVDYFSQMEGRIQAAIRAMAELERGAIANPDENRMVGHYWLRAPQLAPTPEITANIEKVIAAAKAFADNVHTRQIKPLTASQFTQLLCIGIGGSALGPMFVADALGNPQTDKMHPHFIDNTDPDGMARVLAQLSGKLGETLVLVTSKSGSTPEPRNAMLVVADAYAKAGLDFAKHAVAITGVGSQLDKTAEEQGWLRRFPMYDWVGGRTSQFSAVGLVPATLQGLDVDAMLAGAADCDEVTRNPTTRFNPAALMALMWYQATGGKGQKDMVVLPYKDRLLLLSRYLQQLVMESLGKRLDLQGNRVDQGLTVYGNKGSTDQHAFVQQLRDGINNFFVVFIRVLEGGGEHVEVEPGVTANDYLHGFLLGTRQALAENERQSLTITIRKADARSIGVLIALFERAVGYYGSLVNINPYHQPGVEAGKKAAAAVLQLQAKLTAALDHTPRTAEQLAAQIGANDHVETVYLLLEHLCANGRAKTVSGTSPAERTFSAIA
jgi:glucose-6-phosphate isomerase